MSRFARGIIVKQLPEMVTETIIPGDGYCTINSIIHSERARYENGSIT